MLSVTATAELCENMRETLERVSLVLVVSAQKSIHKASDGDKRKDIWAAALLGAQRKLHYIYIHNSWLNCTSWYLKSSSLSLSLSAAALWRRQLSFLSFFISRQQRRRRRWQQRETRARGKVHFFKCSLCNLSYTKNKLLFLFPHTTNTIRPRYSLEPVFAALMDRAESLM